MEEALFLGQIQVAEAVMGDVSGDSKNCFHGGGTSNYHHHFQNFQITTASGRQLSYGLSEMVSGDAQTIFSLFSEAIANLCYVVHNGESTEISFRAFSRK